MVRGQLVAPEGGWDEEGEILDLLPPSKTTLGWRLRGVIHQATAYG